jgi:hypothetical protein
VLVNVPAVYVAVLEQVKLNVAKLTSPEVCAYVVQDNAPANVVVPEVVLITNAVIVLPFGVTVPVPTKFTDNAV